MDLLKSKSQARIEENEKLSLFYQHELQQWLEKLNKQKVKWQNKRDNLLNNCYKLQESLKGKWSESNNKLNIEKEKYCNIIIQLLPEWQKAIERKQMREISEYESKVSLIQQRRHNADIAFEKEKKLLSIISIRQKEIQRLREEEKQDAMIREHERKSIVEQEKAYNDKLKLTQSDSFADIRLQEYIIRKEVTSELEKKYSEKFDEIKAKLIQNHTRNFDDDDIDNNDKKHKTHQQQPLHDMDIINKNLNVNMKSTTTDYSKQEYTFDTVDDDDNDDLEEDEEEDQQHHEDNDEEKNQEINEDNDDDELHLISNIKEEEGNETQPSTLEFNAEQGDDHNEHISVIIPKQSQQVQSSTQKIQEKEVLSNTIMSVHEHENVNEKSIDIDDGLDTQEIMNNKLISNVIINDDDDVDDTAKIERAVGLIEINHGKNVENNADDNDAANYNGIPDGGDDVNDVKKEISKPRESPLRISITKENDQQMEYQSPKQQKERIRQNTQNDSKKQQNAKPQTNSKLRRSFRARTSKNRLQFSVLAGSPMNDKNNESDRQSTYDEQTTSNKSNRNDQSNKTNEISNVKYTQNKFIAMQRLFFVLFLFTIIIMIIERN